MPNPNEQEQFLKEFNSDETTNPFAHLEGQDNTGTDVSPDNEIQTDANANDTDEPKPKNRRERRLEARLNAEREAGIALAAKLAALTEQPRTQTDGEYLKSLDKLFGTDTPEAREATEILKSAIQGAKDDAKREALEAYEERTQRETQAVRDAEQQLDSMVEEIEDEFDVDLTSAQGEKARTDFFKLLERMSPKDRDGNILYYADHIAVWEDYQTRLQRKADPTAKNLAARTMTTGAPAAGSNLTKDVNERYLLEQGII